MMAQLILIFTSSYLTHFIAHTRQLHRVTSSALASLILIALIRLLSFNFPQMILSLPIYETTIFGASFLGMSTHHRIEYKTLWLSALIYFALLKLSGLLVISLGGTLGFMAFISTITTVLVAHLLRKKVKIFALAPAQDH